jgi:hypothetical protein
MDGQLLLSAITAGAALAGLAVSTMRLQYKLAAQRRLANLLASDPASVRLQAVRERMVHDGVATAGDLQQLIGHLERLTRTLPVEQQRLIEEGLLQRSVRGRTRYAERLMDKAGLGSGSLPIPVR